MSSIISHDFILMMVQDVMDKIIKRGDLPKGLNMNDKDEFKREMEIYKTGLMDGLIACLKLTGTIIR